VLQQQLEQAISLRGSGVLEEACEQANCVSALVAATDLSVRFPFFPNRLGLMEFVIARLKSACDALLKGTRTAQGTFQVWAGEGVCVWGGGYTVCHLGVTLLFVSMLPPAHAGAHQLLIRARGDMLKLIAVSYPFPPKKVRR
jgi:hypothetical protein